MADTVNVSKNKGTAYTWKTSPFKWKNAIKSWKDASPNQYTVNRLSYVSIAGSLKKMAKVKRKEAFWLAEACKSKAAIKRKESVKMRDKTLMRIAKKAGKEAFKVAEKSNRHPKPKKIETALHIADSRKLSLRRLLYEKIRTTETYWDNIKFKLHILEMFKTRDIAKKRASNKLYDRFAATDKVKNKSGKRLREAVKATGLIRKHEAKKLKDAARLMDGVQRKFKLIPHDSVCLADKARHKGTINRRDGVKLTDEFLRHAIMWLGFEESLKAVDNTLKNYKAHYGESFETAEAHNKHLSKNRQETAQFKDVFDRLYIARKTIEDNIKVAEQFKKQYSLEGHDGFAMYDAFIKACEAVLSNLAIRYGELDDDGFMKLVNAPSGYTDFTDFKVGEYEYKEALVRIVLETKVPQSPASVADVVLHVDIPDTDDRGVAQITDITAATKIYFNKHYYNPPEVNVVLRAGSTANSNVVPYIVSTGGQDDAGRYFEVELIAANGERTTGTISWVSKGY